MRPQLRAAVESRTYGVRTTSWRRPLRWLALGWRDLWRTPAIGLVHGAAVAAFGAVLLAVAHQQFWWLAGAFSGFLLVAPVIATGLYAVSRALERGEAATWATVGRAWQPDNSRLVGFGLLLALAGTGWVLTSASFIWAVAGSGVHTPRDFLLRVVLDDQRPVFEAWLALGGVLAAPVFASSVLAMPMLLDRKVGIWVAVFTSWRAVMADGVAMASWAALIMGLTALGMVTAFIGLVVIVPWLGHASWHAYRDLIVPPTASRSWT